jgi:hypothetical protein
MKPWDSVNTMDPPISQEGKKKRKKKVKMEFERGSPRSHSVDNSLWKRL